MSRQVDLGDGPPSVPEPSSVDVVRDIGPNDIIVLRFKEPVSREGAARLQEAWAHKMKGHPAEKCKLVVLDGGVELSVLRFTSST